MQLKINKRLLLLSVLALVTGFSWWLLRGLTPAVQIDSEVASNEPDYFLENFNVKMMGKNGKLEKHLFADSMYHFPIDDRATLQRPHMIFYSDDIPAWDIRGEGGLVTAGGESVLLSGEVLMERINSAAGEHMEIITSDLMIKPEEDYAETGQPVKIRYDYGVTDAVGMLAYFKARRLTLLSEVKGVYDPTRD